MTTTAGDVLVETLLDWGVDTVFGLPGDGINGIMEALRTRQDKIRFVQVRHEESGGVHGLRLRQMDRPARRLPRDLGPGRHPPPERALRREAGRGAGAGDHRTAVPRPDRDLYPAGRRARQAVPGRGRLQCAGDGAGARAQRGRARLPHGAGPSRRGAYHHAGRPPVRAGQGRAAALGAQHCGARRLGAAGGRGAGAGRGPGGQGGGDPEPEQEALHPGRARGAGGGRGPDGGGRAAGRAGGDGAPGQGGHPRRQPLCHRRRRAARHAAVAGGAGGLRRAADRRQHLPLHRVLPAAGPGARRPDRPRPAADRAALPGRGGAGGRCGPLPRGAAAAARAARGPLVPGDRAGRRCVPGAS